MKKILLCLVLCLAFTCNIFASWETHTQVDEFTDEISYFIRGVSSNGHSIIISFHNEYCGINFSFNASLWESDVVYRIDKEQAVTIPVSYDKNKSIFIAYSLQKANENDSIEKNYFIVLKQLLNGKKLIVRTNDVLDRTIQAEFDLSGLSEVLNSFDLSGLYVQKRHLDKL